MQEETDIGKKKEPETGNKSAGRTDQMQQNN